MKNLKLMLGDNITSLKKIPDNSIDSIVTDPPYGLSFMNKKWDHNVPSVEFWKEIYRVLKPGGHILSFGGTRTYHRMVVNIEDAGFEIRDQIMWIYSSGFPKSLNVGKAVDKKQGNEREVVGEYIAPDGNKRKGILSGKEYYKEDEDVYNNDERVVTKGNSEFEGWGTATKPANEPICVARKPLSEKTVAENMIKWKTGGINIDGCRIGNEIIKSPQINTDKNMHHNYTNKGIYNGVIKETEGRFPANIIFECICDEVIKGEKGEKRKGNPGGNTFGGVMKEEVVGNWYNDTGDIHTNPDCPCYILDKQSGITKAKANNNYKHNKTECDGNTFTSRGTYTPRTDKGGASRFFYVAKVSKAERNMGLDKFEDKCGNTLGKISGNPDKETEPKKNHHPTIKPINLMSYLIRLVTPENGIVLDPFMGSGSTGIAAMLEGKRFVGMEMDEEYFKIAEGRINSWEQYKKFIK